MKTKKGVLTLTYRQCARSCIRAWDAVDVSLFSFTVRGCLLLFFSIYFG